MSKLYNNKFPKKPSTDFQNIENLIDNTIDTPKLDKILHYSRKGHVEMFVRTGNLGYQISFQAQSPRGRKEIIYFPHARFPELGYGFLPEEQEFLSNKEYKYAIEKYFRVEEFAIEIDALAQKVSDLKSAFSPLLESTNTGYLAYLEREKEKSRLKLHH